MKNSLIKARVIKTDKIIEVYALLDKDKYCDYADCYTIYDIMELDFEIKRGKQ